jgi:hypothetical protein
MSTQAPRRFPRFSALVAATAIGAGLGVGCDEAEGGSCEADVDCKGERICDQGACIFPEDWGGDDGDSEGGALPGSGDGSSADDGSGPVPGDDGADAGGAPDDPFVGAWSAAGTVNTDEGPISVEIGWYLCADERMAGFTAIDGFQFLDKGSYSASGPSMTVTWTSKDTSIGDVWGPETVHAEYDEGTDTFTFTDGNFGATMVRLEGEVVNADCDPSW